MAGWEQSVIVSLPRELRGLIPRKPSGDLSSASGDHGVCVLSSNVEVPVLAIMDSGSVVSEKGSQTGQKEELRLGGSGGHDDQGQQLSDAKGS